MRNRNMDLIDNDTGILDKSKIEKGVAQIIDHHPSISECLSEGGCDVRRSSHGK